MPAKWFRFLPERIELLLRAYDEEARAQRLWCFDSGPASFAVGLLMALASDQPGLLTDRWNRLCDRYCEASRRLLVQQGPELARLARATDGRVEELLARTADGSAQRSLADIEMHYAPTHAAADGEDWTGRIGLVFSGGSLEHYAPAQLEAEVVRMGRALRPGGIMSHVVDHRDHRWHSDKMISPLEHLTMEEEPFLRRFGNPLEYHNRWLCSQYVDLFTRHGFQVEAHPIRLYESGFIPLDRSRLATPFRDASEEDLSSLVTRFVAVRHT
jgi:SAM-dependent methyltransferase